MILSPTWALLGYHSHDAYVDDLTREDYAFPSKQALSNTDLSVDFQIRYGATTNIGVAMRAQDSLRMYCVEVDNIDPRRASAFNVVLWRQDASGFRRQLAHGLVPHPKAPYALGPETYQQWVQSSPGWSTLHVRAIGPHIQVWVRGQKVIDSEDSTYTAGAVGLIARWAVMFRNLKISGTPATLKRPWHVIAGTWPKYTLPFDGQLGNFEVFPQIARDQKTGTLYVVANVAPTAGWNKNDLDIGIVRSKDGGKTWVDPEKFRLGKYVPQGGGYAPILYIHKDGHLTCFYDQRPSLPKGPLSDIQRELAPKTIGYSESYDGGHTWSKARELVVSGKPASQTVPKHSLVLYAPVERLRNGTLLLACYYFLGVYGSPPIDQASSTIFRSTDDGATWTGPYTIDKKLHDTGEVSVVQLPSGRLLALMRTGHATHMWKSYSDDDGKTWSPLEHSTITNGDCPTFLKLRSGTIVFAYRGYGVYMKVSRDGGKTWGPVTRITPAAGMTGMIEMPDGRILIVYHTGYRAPGRIRAQFLRVEGDGVEAAW